MLVFYLLATGVGAALLVLSLFLSPAARPSTGELRLYAFPLLAVGSLGTTLHLLERPFLTTVSLSLAVGVPTGLLATWLLHRFDGKRESEESEG